MHSSCIILALDTAGLAHRYTAAAAAAAAATANAATTHAAAAATLPPKSYMNIFNFHLNYSDSFIVFDKISTWTAGRSAHASCLAWPDPLGVSGFMRQNQAGVAGRGPMSTRYHTAVPCI